LRERLGRGALSQSNGVKTDSLDLWRRTGEEEENSVGRGVVEGGKRGQTVRNSLLRGEKVEGNDEKTTRGEMGGDGQTSPGECHDQLT